ncbi:MAG: YidC/Oxa1 family membrane protein insertase [Acidimicrobiia bacterium]|nr:YidC/Oxa1 family membrane protein insertase [Acidimicrobiia bacterium]MDH3470769.1 YidC/Oxa1 family membrane protein insertase [Acidimicrobiia bacterium]
MWNALLNLLGDSLAFFFEIVPNLGIAIILLTIAINLLLFPLTLKQTRSMRAMSEIQPDVKKLQSEHKADREKLNQELMALYKERGVNPAAGCLPLLLQMPIWFALFRVLREPLDFVHADSDLAGALERGDVRFLGMDLRLEPSNAISDGFVTALPYIILVLVVVATGYYQQLQTTARAKKTGQKVTGQAQSMQTVMKIFPIIFGFISWSMPGGLVLYFAASQIIRIGQQAAIISIDGHAGEKRKPVVEEAVDLPEEDAKPLQTPGQRRKDRKRKRK